MSVKIPKSNTNKRLSADLQAPDFFAPSSNMSDYQGGVDPLNFSSVASVRYSYEQRVKEDLAAVEKVEEPMYFSNPYDGGNKSIYIIRGDEKEELLKRTDVTCTDLPIEEENDLINLLKEGIATLDKSTLYRFLVKADILPENDEAIGFAINHYVTRNNENPMKKVSYMATSFAVKTVNEIEHIINMALSNRQQLTDVIANIVVEVYITNPNDILNIHCDTRDVYQEILSEFSKRDIQIDKDFLAYKDISFTELRKKNKTLSLFFSPIVPELILCRHRKNSFHLSLKNFFDASTTKFPIKESIPEDDVEKININGIEYQKRIFENVVESSFDIFIDNLNTEIYISEIRKH
jgi:hypothetical protein